MSRKCAGWEQIKIPKVTVSKNEIEIREVRHNYISLDLQYFRPQFFEFDIQQGLATKLAASLWPFTLTTLLTG